MKSKFILFVAMLSLVSIGSVSCEEEETTSVSGDECLTELEALSDIMLEKLYAFNANQSSGNCEAYKTAWMNVYNKTKSCGYTTTELDQVKDVVLTLCDDLD